MTFSFTIKRKPVSFTEETTKSFKYLISNGLTHPISVEFFFIGCCKFIVNGGW